MSTRSMGRIAAMGIALGLWAGAATSAQAAMTPLTHLVVNGSQGSLAARATFDINGSTMTVLLENTSKADALVPTDVLTALFWDPTANLKPESAVLGNGSTVLFPPADGSGPVVGGEWAYKAGLSGAPGGAVLGISSSGLGLFGPSDLFPPGVNLQGPLTPDGLQYGITSAGDNPATGNGAVTGKNALIKNSVLFTLTVTGTYDLANVHNVTFQYGTALGETHYGGTPVPEPTTMIAGALLLLPFGLSTVRILRRRQAA